MASKNNSSWLEAYEAQKAKALLKIQDRKKQGQNADNVAGLSGYSGCVQAMEVAEFSSKTGVTKLLNDLKCDGGDEKSKSKKEKTPQTKSLAAQHALEPSTGSKSATAYSSALNYAKHGKHHE